MKLLIEEYQYDVADVFDVLDGLFTLQNVEGKISVSYVGYYYNPKINDVVFILPKVLVSESVDGKYDKVFGKYEPRDLVNLEDAKLEPHEAKFIYEFSVWIHRAIVVYNNTHERNGIIFRELIEREGHGAKKKTNTWLDVILSLIRFAKYNRSFFTSVLKNIHSGHNKINWTRTISGTTAVVQNDSPVYLNPVNKKRQINFDEELIVIFFSILNYVAEHFGFRTEIPFGFPLIKGAKFERYIDGFGSRRLRQIKYKYFSDVATRLWDLCYAFFDKAYQIKTSADNREYLLAKSFNIVFEAMIEELIGDNDVPKGLKEQADGKLVDHFYTYEGLLINRDKDNDIYYIGDSKYYKIGSKPGKESVYKQYTYARNVIQWNLNLFLNPSAKVDEKDRYRKIKLRDDVTEGYNIIPNFFISANIDPITLSYEDRKVRREGQENICRQFENRLYDRDTLIVSHYDVNFLFVLSLYARDNAGAKAQWKTDVRRKFREEIQGMLKDRFEFYAMTAHADVDGEKWLKENFQQVLGKTYSPFIDKEVFSLALDKDDKYKAENDALIASLKENFYVVQCPLGTEPTARIAEERQIVGDVNSPAADKGLFLFGIVNKMKAGKDGSQEISKEYMAFSKCEAEDYVMRNMPGGDISKVKYFVPLFDGGIAGYYEITGISFGMRQKETRDVNGNEVTVPMPCLNIKLGQYTPLGDHTVEVPKFRNWNGQIHTAAEVQELFEKSLTLS
ncbi:MAG: LlaJI family restriction endonuclease [[Clostridium] fimetarium]|nr:LlaJI family restriction endonuclease [Alistipes timonensis]MCM1405689.1 LlaJI family restriction endonuclease [[Clostridium] fimetarium]